MFIHNDNKHKPNSHSPTDWKVGRKWKPDDGQRAVVVNSSPTPSARSIPDGDGPKIEWAEDDIERSNDKVFQPEDFSFGLDSIPLVKAF